MYLQNDGKPLPRIAYFCMEFGLNQEFHSYAGGLGILAGDFLKSAKDMGLPVAGIGLLWRKGYTEQYIGEDGWPHDSYPEQDLGMLGDTGATVHIKVRHKNLAVKVWKVDKYGNVPLYLLDTRVPGNDDCWISDNLYGSGSDTRIAQEMVLGIGGIKALQKMGHEVDLYHFNEGHAVFAAIELITQEMDGGSTFAEACQAVRRKIVFTTHTPVPAGNEEHNVGQLMHWGANCGLNYDQMTALGGDPFNMTIAGLRVAAIANGVSRLHGETARRMWSHVAGASEILHITNGVHNGTWQDPLILRDYKDKEKLGMRHNHHKRKLCAAIKERAGLDFNPETLTISFARRAAPYKRHDLIFRNMDVIEPYLKSGRLQLIFAGKAHPDDHLGKETLAKLVKITRQYPNSSIFLQNYDMVTAQLMTRGSDVWLNNPVRPLEASGTSGMKAAMNGVPNLSTLDGWWEETCIHGKCGWSIGNGEEGPHTDESDSRNLYKVLFEEIIPTFYDDKDKWLGVMQGSIDMSSWNYSSDRMLEDYYNKMYIPVVRENQRLEVPIMPQVEGMAYQGSDSSLDSLPSNP